MAKTNKTTNKVINISMTDNGRWAIQKVGNKKPSKTAKTQKEAISIGRDIAKKIGAQMVIYNKKGVERRRLYK